MFEHERGLLVVQTLPRTMIFEVGTVAGSINRFIEVGWDSGPRFPFVKAMLVLNRVTSVELYDVYKKIPYDSAHECQGFEWNGVKLQLVMCRTTPGPAEECTLECS